MIQLSQQQADEQLSKNLKLTAKGKPENSFFGTIDLKSKNTIYDIKEICKSNYYNDICSSTLSRNGEYLVYTSQKLMQIYFIKLSQFRKQFFQNRIISLQFTLDTQYLFVGDNQGFVIGFVVSNAFKRFYKQKIHQKLVSIIIAQNSYLITCSQDLKIIKTNFINKNQIFVLVGHQNYIFSIDYDYEKDIVISGSWDRTLKIWNCSSQCIYIDKQKAHENYIYQVQFINNKQNILSLDFLGNLFKWRIDYQNKQLIHLDQYYDTDKILRFQQVNNDRNLFIICNKYWKILNNSWEIINTIMHDRDCKKLLKYQLKVREGQIINNNWITQITSYYKMVKKCYNLGQTILLLKICSNN